MTFACPQCRDTGRVTDRGRFYGDLDIGKPCPDCTTRQNQADAVAEMQARIEERHRIEDRIDARRALYPMGEDA